MKDFRFRKIHDELICGTLGNPSQNRPSICNSDPSI